MKHLVLVFAGLVLAACGHAPPATHTDHARIDAVERAAVRSGVSVHWVNLPQRRAAPGR